MLNPADFNVFDSKPNSVEEIPCKPPACFVGSYPPVSKPGELGPFYVNTYLTQPDRKFETLGPATVRSADFEKCMK
jgi:hypothetical protein|tara:strand:+ start:7320 stop:7547 length:228 start_codon:yes stop_codon:yes gene_type:complete